MTQPDRFDRVRTLIDGSHAILQAAVDEIEADGKRVAGIVALFSGGNDSTTLTHLFRDHVTHAAHANTGIGIEQTRQYVRDTCAGWNLPLIEKHTEPGSTYRDIVLGRCLAKTGPNKGRQIWPGGFPGPASHWLMYQRLKERLLEKVRNEIVSKPRQERVIFLAGRRASESSRRTNRLGGKSAVERKGSIVWVSPILNWTKLDLNTYRMLHPDVPRNEVSDLLHMSGECLCGAFAHPGELDEIAEWFPDVANEIRELEREVQKVDGIPAEQCQWGWGAYRERPSKTGMLCSSCDDRFADQTPVSA